ncbi:MAG: hypothetical protein BWY06_02350 [Candidatus Latescibacteria bacterium ADurb.Bin168]|nr:MAG: hypothetical protein BWY06_02350 [Candidatus Latescibacteria bacterium ADurb.Bin168]
MYAPNPWVIWWFGFTTHSRSRSAASRQQRPQLVPIILRKIFDMCPECITINPMPCRMRV